MRKIYQQRHYQDYPWTGIRILCKSPLTKKEIVSEIINNKGWSKGDFTINLKLINQYKQKDPRLKTNDKMGTYKKEYFRGGSNINHNLITCYDKIVIMSRFKSYILHWYHTYFLHPGMDRTEAIIYQHLYWTLIINLSGKN